MAAQRRSVWDGVFTQPQAARGAESYQYSCATCHSPDLEGDAGRDVPALYGEGFVGSWNGRTIKDLFDLVRKAMPKDSPGSLKAETYADIVAFLLQANEFPAGARELPIDPAALERIGIEKVPPRAKAWSRREAVPPERVEETREIRRRIRQPIAGGEILYGVAGFAPLSRNQTVHVIMPDVKHCRGLLELTRIAAAADHEGVTVAPHNPSGPVSTAASIQVCAVLKNFRLLEFQCGEVEWRGEILNPPERFENGAIRTPDRPGFGIELNERIVRAHLM